MHSLPICFARNTLPAWKTYNIFLRSLLRMLRDPRVGILLVPFPIETVQRHARQYCDKEGDYLERDGMVSIDHREKEQAALHTIPTRII
jgi:hypothetical protein